MARLLLILLLSIQFHLSGNAQISRVPYSVDELQRRTFNFFWELADQNAQIPDRWPTLAFSSIAATGFGLSSYIVGVERGWVTRDQAAERVLKTLKTLSELPQGDTPAGMAGYKGFFYHFLDHQKSLRYKDVELSSIDSGLLLAGVLSCQTYFDRNNPAEKAIRDAADFLYRRVEWDWMLNANNRLSMGWKPESKFIQAEWFGYTEAMILYVLALGSPTHTIPAESWDAWCQSYYWDEFMGQEHVNFGPLFGHQYSHVWIDFREIQDDYMRKKGLDYFENSRRATLANQAYCVKNPRQYKAYSDKVWGLTACDGPVDWLSKHDPRRLCPEDWKNFRGYSARGAAADYLEDDGTIAPTAAGGSVPFAPEICLPALETLWNTYYDSLVGPYGFKDCFNPTFTACGQLPNGWFDTDYLGIDQGPILLMPENHRSGLIWNIMKKNPYIRTGLQRAGFRGGWLGYEGFTPAPFPATAPNPEAPTNPRFYFDRAVYREHANTALPYCFLRPANGLASNSIPGLVLTNRGQLADQQGRERKLPLVVFLHGSGERGFDNESQLRNGVYAFVEPENYRKNPCFILAPQCPPGVRWSGTSMDNSTNFSEQPTEPMRLLISLIQQILDENPAIDRNRIYVAGLSMGGAGAVDLLMRKPEWFAAGIPVCGGGDPQFAGKIKDIPLWLFHGLRDEVRLPEHSRRLAKAMEVLNAPVKYTEYATLGHSIWQETFYNPAVLDWLFAQHK